MESINARSHISLATFGDVLSSQSTLNESKEYIADTYQSSMVVVESSEKDSGMVMNHRKALTIHQRSVDDALV